MEASGTGSTGMEVFNEVKCAVVVCAHADDMETMMGGTAWLLAQQGVALHELICTRGDLGTHSSHYTRDTLAAQRKEEASSGARLLGFRQVVTLGHHDGELEPALELRAEIARHYRLWQPDTLFTFDPAWAAQIHPDHRAAGRAAIDAIMPSKMPLYRAEQLAQAGVADIKRAFLFSPAEPDIFIDITGVYSHKLQSALAHNSQFPDGEQSLNWMRDLDRAAAERSGLNVEYAEQFSTLRVW